jgi:glycosyltransferase involved in cell wall biosynthesis
LEPKKSGKAGVKVQTADLSILIPVKNIEQEIPGILQFAAQEAQGISAEFIIVDTGSGDKTVLRAVQLMKQLGLNGFVIQNGESAIPAALNTAVQKAGGRYLTFLFARRLYGGFLPRFLEAAGRSGADFIFGCTSKEEVRAAERRVISSAVRQPKGSLFAEEILRRNSGGDIAAVLVRRQFLLDREISFSDSCVYGYAEEFVFCCLFCADSVVQAPVLLTREPACELKRGKQAPAGRAIFQRVEAMLRVLDVAKAQYGGERELLRLLEKEKIPRTVMDSVDVLLREGSSSRAVRACLRISGYSRLLTVDRWTDPALRRRVLLWKTAPDFYRP